MSIRQGQKGKDVQELEIPAHKTLLYRQLQYQTVAGSSIGPAQNQRLQKASVPALFGVQCSLLSQHNTHK